MEHLSLRFVIALFREAFTAAVTSHARLLSQRKWLPKKGPVIYTAFFTAAYICMKLLKREFLYSTVYIERDCLESKADLWTLSLQSLLQHMQGSGATTAATRARSCQVKDHTIYICMGLTLWLQRLFGLESPCKCLLLLAKAFPNWGCIDWHKSKAEKKVQLFSVFENGKKLRFTLGLLYLLGAYFTY